METEKLEDELSEAIELVLKNLKTCGKDFKGMFKRHLDYLIQTQKEQ
jgi:hypothetical protein